MVTNIWMLCIMRKNVSMGYHRSLLNANTFMNRRPSIFLKIEDENKRKQLRMTQIFGAIFVINIITWIPLLIVVILVQLPRQIIVPVFILFAQLCFLSQIVLHPILQVVLLKDIRIEITRCCSYLTCRAYSSPSNASAESTARCSGTYRCKKSGCDILSAINNPTCLHCCGILDVCSAAVIAHGHDSLESHE